MTRPPGGQVAPLPDGGLTRMVGGVAIVRFLADYGVGAVLAGNGDVTIAEGPVGSAEPETVTGAPADAVVRALHDAGQLDAYRERCEAAAWVRFDAEDPTSWPDEEVSVLFRVEGRASVAYYDREAGVWNDGHTRYGVPRRHAIHWRPLPAGPVRP